MCLHPVTASLGVGFEFSGESGTWCLRPVNDSYALLDALNIGDCRPLLLLSNREARLLQKPATLTWARPRSLLNIGESAPGQTPCELQDLCRRTISLFGFNAL
jgi:hypothetical protein